LIQLYDEDAFPPYVSREKPSYPVVYRHHIYFLSDEEAKERFIQSPQTYLQQVSPKPLVPIKVAIIGPPKSGKTTRKLEMLLILFLLFLLLLFFCPMSIERNKCTH